MDNDDYAVIQQQHKGNVDASSLENDLSDKKKTEFLDEYKHGKKLKDIKHISFKFLSVIPEKKQFPLTTNDLSSPPFASEWYAYLYYKEINPPPPKFC